MTPADARPAGRHHIRRPLGPLLHPGEPPADLGPWVPPLPEPPTGLSRTTGGLLAGFVVALVIGTAIVVGLQVRASTTSPESTYLASIRAHATLTGVSETDLVRAGQAVCSTVAARPTRAGLVGAFIQLSASTGWSSHNAAAIVGAAVEAFCPQYAGLLH